jgi:hypothetical protein
MQFNHICVLVTLALLTACGDNQVSNAAPTNDQSASTAEKTASQKQQPLMMTVTGAEAFTFSYNTMFGCNANAITVATMSHLPKLELVMPLTIEAGEYELMSYDANNTQPDKPMFLVIGELTQARKDAGSSYGASYTSVSDGKLIIQNLPKAKGGVFDATLSATMSDPKGNTIDVNVKFAVPNKGYCSL